MEKTLSIVEQEERINGEQVFLFFDKKVLKSEAGRKISNDLTFDLMNECKEKITDLYL